MKSKGIAPLPSNIRHFSPKILGLNARDAIILILVVSVSALSLRFSSLLAIAILFAGLFMFIPLNGGKSPALSVYVFVRWRLAGLQNFENHAPFVSEEDGIPVIIDGTMAGYILEVKPESFYKMSEQRMEEVNLAASRILQSHEGNIAFLAVPVTVKPPEKYRNESSVMSMNYADYLSYLFKEQYYYRSFVTIWKRREKGNRTDMASLYEYAETICGAFRSYIRDCSIVRDKVDAEMLLDALR